MEEPMSIESLIRVVPEGRETVFDLMDEGGEVVRTLRVGSRELQPEPPEAPVVAPARARCHTFYDADAFAAYLNREAASAKSIALADFESQSIVAVLDEGSEEDREQVSLKAKPHPLLQPWLSMIGNIVPVTEFALFIMKNRRTIIEPDGRELAMVFSQVKMSKSLQIHTGVGKKAINGVVATVEIAGQKQDQVIELPETISLQLPLYLGTEPQVIELDLLVTEHRDQAVVCVTAADLEVKRVEAFRSMVAKIGEETNVLVGLGVVAERDWRVID